MKHLDIMVPQRWFLGETKARIDHPEDAVFDGGAAAALQSLHALLHAADEPSSITIKWDGSVALIFGYDEHGFTLTDKAGFANKKPTGLPRTAHELHDMLFLRKPEDHGRKEYATSIAKLFDPLKKMLPRGFSGFLQADVLWLSTPPVVGNKFVFKPSKTSYRIPTDSSLGKMIAKSHVGISIHSRFESRDEPEPLPIGSMRELHLNKVAGIVAMGAEITDLRKTAIPKKMTNSIEKLIHAADAPVSELFDRSQLALEKISDLPAAMKRYVAKRAESGTHGLDNAADGFLTWVDTPASQLTDRKRANYKAWIAEHPKGYSAAWQIAAALLVVKNQLKRSVDKHASKTIDAELKGSTGHEGYVISTPHGKYKLVNRPVFMRKEHES